MSLMVPRRRKVGRFVVDVGVKVGESLEKKPGLLVFLGVVGAVCVPSSNQRRLLRLRLGGREGPSPALSASASASLSCPSKRNSPRSEAGDKGSRGECSCIGG